jgi:hypothetical protein
MSKEHIIIKTPPKKGTNWKQKKGWISNRHAWQVRRCTWQVRPAAGWPAHVAGGKTLDLPHPKPWPATPKALDLPHPNPRRAAHKPWTCHTQTQDLPHTQTLDLQHTPVNYQLNKCVSWLKNQNINFENKCKMNYKLWILSATIK